MNEIRRISFQKVVRPMRTLFVTSLGKKSAATSMLVRVVLNGGAEGLGEVPTSFVMKHETVEAIEAILTEARGELAGVPIDEYETKLATIRRRHKEFHMTLAGLEVALFRAALASRGESEFAHWGGRAKRLETDITIPFLPEPGMVEQWLGKIAKVGFAVYKIKVSGQIPADMEFVGRVHRLLSETGERFTIRLDGNQGYCVRGCLRMQELLVRAKIPVELMEQPLPKDNYRGLRDVRKRSNVPVILDETVFSAADCRRVIDEELGDGVNIKIAKSGIAESAAILKLAKQAGLKLMIGCMTETMVGLSAGIRLAAGTGAFDYVDLDSIHLIHHPNLCGEIRVAGREFLLGDERC